MTFVLQEELADDEGVTGILSEGSSESLPGSLLARSDSSQKTRPPQIAVNTVDIENDRNRFKQVLPPYLLSRSTIENVEQDIESMQPRAAANEVC